MFELAVLELKEAEVESGERVLDPIAWVAQQSDDDSVESESTGNGHRVGVGSKEEVRAKRVRAASIGNGVTESEEGKEVWRRKVEAAGKRLDVAMGLAGSEIDLSTRLDSRIVMLRDEIAAKKDALGI